MNNLFHSNRAIQKRKINLGQRTISVPVYVQSGKTHTHTVLITAGMDGDEYVGIEAAYQLIEKYSKREINGKIIIIPIVNIPGFESKMSKNPMDGKFPKFVIKGNAYGSPTDRLIHWLNSEFSSVADVWIDLHGGAFNESLVPFVWFFKTKNTALNHRIQEILPLFRNDRVVYQKSISIWRTDQLSKHNCNYMIFESGDRGNAHKEDIERHIYWVEKILDNYNIWKSDTSHQLALGKNARLYTQIHEILASTDGLYYPNNELGTYIMKGDTLGHISSQDKHSKKIMTSPCSGEVLWKHVGLSVTKGETIAAISS